MLAQDSCSYRGFNRYRDQGVHIFTSFLVMVRAAALIFVVFGMSRANSHERVNCLIINFIMLLTVLISMASVPLFYYSNKE